MAFEFDLSKSACAQKIVEVLRVKQDESHNASSLDDLYKLIGQENTFKPSTIDSFLGLLVVNGFVGVTYNAESRRQYFSVIQDINNPISTRGYVNS